ncbi:MAG TPA: phosphatidylserine decarboxylase [Bdellovibrionales bacterium]|nr:MAG: hypothetical protein A2X97_07540 [Bdellovibrionales bacterium GWA1_52_35]OFZ40331.1 MAG: hypothetical protein A2070_11675 [Bdellovibrionales bacterium GWC1_52_8]HAR41831.1 phosphatidylserine decarboxylase [Bdellovibrionales bacterium]HCM41351.1 phosphatidylserine decarboxylase [Bdellovibrionales bacterium]
MIFYPEPKAIRYWNRAKACEEVEQVYGELWVQLLYGTRPGQALAESVLAGRALSELYGLYQSSPLSRRKIKSFISQFKIPMNEYESSVFLSFNDFFIRRFKPNQRKFNETPELMPAPCEARYFAYAQSDPNSRFPVKGAQLSPAALLGSEDRARPFIGGPALLARLCPVDYHRFHYPDSGKTLETHRAHGKLHSVNPAALTYRDDILLTNERQISILQTEHFGRLAYIEVGALCVGRIVQTHPAHSSSEVMFERGDEKGYFLFGGSTVILLGEPGAWEPDADLLSNTERGLETLVRLGEPLAKKGGLR